MTTARAHEMARLLPNGFCIHPPVICYVGFLRAVRKRSYWTGDPPFASLRVTTLAVRLVYSPRPSSLGPHPSSLGPHPSSLIPHPSSLIPHPSALGPRPSSQ